MFDNLRHPLLIFLNLPLALFRRYLYPRWLRVFTWLFSASIGFIALFGVAVLNGVVLVGSYE
jgi:cobalt-zinc-cadmium resistance protein CzcA